MSKPDVVNWKEAGELVNRIEDPATRRIISRAVMIARLRFYETSRTNDFDLQFFTEVLSELFRNPDVIRQELDGKRPGAWSENPTEYGI